MRRTRACTWPCHPPTQSSTRKTACAPHNPYQHSTCFVRTHSHSLARSYKGICGTDPRAIGVGGGGRAAAGQASPQCPLPPSPAATLCPPLPPPSPSSHGLPTTYMVHVLTQLHGLPYECHINAAHAAAVQPTNAANAWLAAWGALCGIPMCGSVRCCAVGAWPGPGRHSKQLRRNNAPKAQNIHPGHSKIQTCPCRVFTSHNHTASRRQSGP